VDLGNIGLVHTGGGAKCGFGAGALMFFEENAVRIKHWQGISAGAINVTKCVTDGARSLAAEWLNFERNGPGSVFSRWEAAKHYFTSRPSLYSDDGLNKLISHIDMGKLIGAPEKVEVVVWNETLEKIKVVCNRDFNDSPENRDKLRRFVKASASFCGLFSPEKIDGYDFSDGCECALESFADCDTVLFIENDQPMEKADTASMGWGDRMKKRFHTFLDRHTEREQRDFITKHKFTPFPEDVEKAPWPVTKNILEFFKDLGKDLAGLPRKRFVTISPTQNIKTLMLDRFNKGDISKSMQNGYDRAKEVLSQIT